MKPHALILLAAACFPFSGCGGQNGGNSSDAVWQAQQQRVEKQFDEYDQQSKIVADNLEAYELEMKRSAALQDKVEQQTTRYEKLLIRWEEQADRMDTLLDKLEKERLPQN